MAVYIYSRVSQDEAAYYHCGVEIHAKHGGDVTCPQCNQKIDTSQPPARVLDQKNDCTRYLDAFGIEGERYFVWEVTSAGSSKLAERSGGSRLLKVLKPGDVIVVTKLDRMFRSTLDACQMIELFDKKQVTFHLIEMRLDTSTAMGRFTVQLMASLAELEYAQQGERRKTRARHLKANGLSTGNVPFGFKPFTELDENGKRIVRRVPDDDERRLLVEILKMKAEGMNRSEMHRRINLCGWKNRRGMEYSESNIKRLVTLAIDWRNSGWDDKVLLAGFRGNRIRSNDE